MLAIANGIQGIQIVTSGGVSQTAAIKVTASVGGGSQSSESHSTASTNQGTTVKAGNAVTVVATGSGLKDADGFATDGDITGHGAQIEGKTVTLSAARDVNLESAQDHSTLDSRSSGNNASVGVGFGLGGDQNGFTLELAASQNKAKANGEAVTNHNSHVVGTDKVTVVSGRDTNLKGAQLIGETVEATVGRDLNIESRPDTETYHSKESSSGMQASICVPPFCYGATVHASGSVTQGNTDSTYSAVQEQSGLYAGKGGFNVDVKGNSDLTGGILASTADPTNNHFKTGTLTTSDIENKAEYSSDSSTFVASYSGGKSVPNGVDPAGNAVTQGVKWAGNTGLLQSGASSLAATAAGNAQRPIDGSAAGVTRSAIAAGAVTIADSADQQEKTGKSADETIASLNRDTASANQRIGKIFDAQQVTDQRERNQLQSQVAQQLAPMVYDQVGTLTRDQSPEVKVAVHAVIGGLMAQAMGGSFAAGAAGDAAATAAAELVGQQILNNPDLQKLSADDRKALVQIVGTIVAAGAGATVGGSTQDAAAAGAAGGLGTQYNWALHPPVYGPSVPPTPGEPQKPGSVPGKPKYDGDESVLTGTPDQSQQNALQVIAQPALEAIENVGAVVGAILPNPLKLVEGNGAILNSSNDYTNGTGQLSSTNVEQLSGAGQAIDPADRGGEMTTAGRALQKHGSRPGSAFPQAKGNPSQMNDQGQKVLDEILNSPGSTVKEGNRFGGIDVIAPDGRGARFDANGVYADSWSLPKNDLSSETRSSHC